MNASNIDIIIIKPSSSTERDIMTALGQADLCILQEEGRIRHYAYVDGLVMCTYDSYDDIPEYTI